MGSGSNPGLKVEKREHVRVVSVSSALGLKEGKNIVWSSSACHLGTSPPLTVGLRRSRAPGLGVGKRSPGVGLSLPRPQTQWASRIFKFQFMVYLTVPETP